MTPSTQVEECVILSNVIEMKKMSVEILVSMKTSSKSRQGWYGYIGKKLEYLTLYPGTGDSTTLDKAVIDGRKVAVDVYEATINAPEAVANGLKPDDAHTTAIEGHVT